MDPGSLPAALRRLDPASRALLDLSLRRGVDDDSIAELLGSDAGTVAADRDRTLERVGGAVGAAAPGDVPALREAIAGLSAERWAEASPEAAAPRQPRRGSVGPPAQPRRESAEPSARPRREPQARPRPSGGGPVRRTERGPVKRSSRAGPLVVGAVLLFGAAVLIASLVSSGDDGGAGADPPGQTVTESRPGAEPPTPGASGDPGPANEPPARDGDGEQAPGGRREAGTPLEPLPGGQAVGRGTAILEGEGEEAALTVDVTGLPTPDGRYEVWLYNSLSDAVSLGRFAGREIELFRPLPANPADYRFLDVSLEPTDGVESHSGRSVLRAPLDGLRQRP